MNSDSIRKVVSANLLSATDEDRYQYERDNFRTPTSIGFPCVKRRGIRKRLFCSPNMSLPVLSVSPIQCVNSVEKVARRPIFDFSPRAINRILEADAARQKNTSLNSLSFLNETISIENILKSCKMEKYIDNFRKEEIDNLAVFSSLTERDLVDIGIKLKTDRMAILETVAIYKGDF